MPTVRSATLGFWIATGSVAETESEAGLSHLVEHMLFRGTDRYGSLEIDQIFDTMGAELNAGTGKENTSVYARVIDDHLPQAFDVVGDMVWHPRIDDADLANEREIVLEEIAMYEDDPQDRVFDVLGEAVFGDHPIGRPVIGRAEVISAVTAAEHARLPRRALRAGRRRHRRRRLAGARRGRRARRAASTCRSGPRRRRRRRCRRRSRRTCGS